MPGFQYRLPTLAEFQDHPIVEKQIGCWSLSGDGKVIVGIESEQWQVWSEELVGSFDRDLSYNHNQNLSRDLTLARDVARNRVFALPLIFALDHDIAHALVHNLTLEHDLNCIFALYRDHYRNRNRDLDVDHNRADARNRDRELDLNLTLTLTLALARTLAHDLACNRNRASDLALALACAHNRSRNIESGFVRFYLLLVAVVWAWLADVYGNASENRRVLQYNKLTRKQCDALNHEYTNKRDEFLQLYAFFVLLDERREGRVPAWEGIRIVRERVND